MTPQTDTLPDLLTVEEAAAILRIGRTAAYELARHYRATNGAEGIPVIAVGRQLRVPRARLEAWIGAEVHAPVLVPVVAPELAPSVRTARPARRSRRAVAAQATLPFAG